MLGGMVVGKINLSTHATTSGVFKIIPARRHPLRSFSKELDMVVGGVRYSYILLSR